MPPSHDLGGLIARARRVSAPILAVTTADPAATMRTVLENVHRDTPEAVAVAWDAARGLFGLNEAGAQLLSTLGAAGTLMPADALSLLQRLPSEGLAFFMNAHRFLEREDVAQAVWNLRDPFKANTRTLVLLAPFLRLPHELTHDVLVLDEPLPGEQELAGIVESTYRSAEMDLPEAGFILSCVQACRGMSAFAAEQALALSLRRSGLAISELWNRKRLSVEQTPGLSFCMDGPSFESLGGLSQIKQLGSGLFSGPQPPHCVVRLDEVEKQMAGSTGDLTGVSQDFVAVLLRAMQDYNWSGLIAVGPPGSGKSAFSKVLGGEFRVPTLEIDLGAARGSLVGESEANIRAIMKVIQAMAGMGGAFFIATCNSITVLPPELRRRFRYGAWMFDLPTAEERFPIWQLYLRAFGHLENAAQPELPDDALWTGADIYNCCELSFRLQCSLKEASAHLLPVAKSAPEQVRTLRELADGRFLSASYPGPYHKPDDAITPALATGRRIGMEP